MIKKLALLTALAVSAYGADDADVAAAAGLALGGAQLPPPPGAVHGDNEGDDDANVAVAQPFRADELGFQQILTNELDDDAMNAHQVLFHDGLTQSQDDGVSSIVGDLAIARIPDRIPGFDAGAIRELVQRFELRRRVITPAVSQLIALQALEEFNEANEANRFRPAGLAEVRRLAEADGLDIDNVVIQILRYPCAEGRVENPVQGMERDVFAMVAYHGMEPEVGDLGGVRGQIRELNRGANQAEQAAFVNYRVRLAATRAQEVARNLAAAADGADEDDVARAAQEAEQAVFDAANAADRDGRNPTGAAAAVLRRLIERDTVAQSLAAAALVNEIDPLAAPDAEADAAFFAAARAEQQRLAAEAPDGDNDDADPAARAGAAAAAAAAGGDEAGLAAAAQRAGGDIARLEADPRIHALGADDSSDEDEEAGDEEEEDNEGDEAGGAAAAAIAEELELQAMHEARNAELARFAEQQQAQQQAAAVLAVTQQFSSQRLTAEAYSAMSQAMEVGTVSRGDVLKALNIE